MKYKSTAWCFVLVVLASFVGTCTSGASVNSGQATPRAATRLSQQLTTRYLSNEQLAAWMVEYTHRCSSISRRFSIGSSVLGTKLWVLEISDKPGQLEPEPSFKYIANMHGDETSGRMLLPMLAEWLCANWKGGDARAARIVKNMHLFLMPTMNPDGFASGRRENANGIDLNRNFPDPHVLCLPDASHCHVEVLKRMTNVQPEVRAVMRWILGAFAKSPHEAVHFTASANLHEGALVANYPYDAYPRGNPSGLSSQSASDGSALVDSYQQYEYWLQQQAAKGTTAAAAAAVGRRTGVSTAPDDDAFVFMARTYADAHKTMHKSVEFPGGITNGAAWYEIIGGMQDWNYIAARCMEITLELSDAKYPPRAKLPQLWEENRDALIALPIASALGGVMGTVKSGAAGNAPLPATIVVQRIDWNVTAHLPFGFYARPLAPGDYVIMAVHEGYQPAAKQVHVPADGSGARVDFVLNPLK